MSTEQVRKNQRPHTSTGDQVVVKPNEFGTFGGVFTPTILTILGVILFMRSNFALGQQGVYNTFYILLLSIGITLLTGLSISAISTNTQVRGGGAYFLISRSLGPEFGGSIGLTLFLAQALSVPFYILGFTEALVTTFDTAAPYFRLICLSVAALLFIVSYIGAEWAIRFQYVVLAVLLLAITSFLIGAGVNFDPAIYESNLAAHPEASSSGYSFWVVFAIYFPAVTGIMAGVNMSGDLKDPAKSIPTGVLSALALALVIYALQIFLCAGSIEREALISAPYQSLVNVSLVGGVIIVTAGVFSATISSAIGSFVAAPRVLQALARDDILTPVRPFADGTVKGDEPRRALWLTLVITVTVIWLAGSGGAEGLNNVAEIVSMFFLAAYGVTNLAAFVEAAGANPSFRPRFRFFHWSLALLGAVGCAFVALTINFQAAFGSVAIIGLIYLYVRQRDLYTSFGDARRGYYYSRVRNTLFRLQEMPTDAKNWRPTILVLSGNPQTRLPLVTYGLWLESGKGVLTIAELLVGNLRELNSERDECLDKLNQFVASNRIPAFVESAVVPDFDHGLRVLLQTHSIGPLKPNMVMFGWSHRAERADSFCEHLRCAAEIGMSVVSLVDKGLPRHSRKRRRIDVWWRGRENGSLMLLLAHLIVSNPDWTHSRIRVLRLASDEEQKISGETELKNLVEEARIRAEVRAVVSTDPFIDILHKESADATAVLLGFFPPAVGQSNSFHEQYEPLLEGLPTTLLVHSTGEADFLA